MPVLDHRPAPLGGLRVALTVLLGLMVVICVFGAVAGFAAGATAADYIADRATLQEVIDAENALINLISVYNLSLVITGIVWIVWQYRYVSNVACFHRHVSLGPRWAIGGWLIPIANFVLGPLQLDKATKASDPNLLPGQSGDDGGRMRMIPAWAITVALGSMTLVSGTITRAEETVTLSTSSFLDYIENDFAGGSQANGTGFAILAIAAVLAILVVRAATARQDEAIDRLTGPEDQ